MKSLGIVDVLALTGSMVLAVAAHAGELPIGCGTQRQACMQTAHVAQRACREDCRQNAAPSQHPACWKECGETFRTTRSTCAGEHTNCMSVLLAAAPKDTTDCLATCGATLSTCVHTVSADLQTCVAACATAANHRACLYTCAKSAQGEAQTCAMNFKTCVTTCVATPAPTPQCSGTSCGGPCVLSPPCPSAGPCPEIVSRLGQCAPDATGTCRCVLPTPEPTRTPPLTPTPECSSVPCGGHCVIVPPCPPGGACPDFVLQGECRDDSSGACQCMPTSAPTQTPVPTCATDADCDDHEACTVDHCVNATCEHACICVTAAGAPACCPGPAALCVRPCGGDASGACGGICPTGATCESLPTAPTFCACVSDVGGPCSGNIFAPPPVCAPGLVCQQSLPDITGVCVKPNCIPFFTAGCSQTSDCCHPCLAGTRAPCAVCLRGTCVGTP
jgi:hypothetical protein